MVLYSISVIHVVYRRKDLLPWLSLWNRSETDGSTDHKKNMAQLVILEGHNQKRSLKAKVTEKYVWTLLNLQIIPEKFINHNKVLPNCTKTTTLFHRIKKRPMTFFNHLDMYFWPFPIDYKNSVAVSVVDIKEAKSKILMTTNFTKILAC